MESYGALLKKAREEKKLDISDVERETSITRHYLEALENEDVSAFPGEPYLVGFLKNYATYLGLNGNDIIKLYHAIQLQQTPTPKELLEKHLPKFVIPLIVILSIAVVVGAGVWLYFFVFNVPALLEARKLAQQVVIQPQQYEFNGDTQNTRLYVGDQILLPAESGTGNVVLTVKDTTGALSIDTPAGTQVIDLSEEREIDINGDGMPEIILYVSDVDLHDGSRGAEVRMLLKDKDASMLMEKADQSTDQQVEKAGNEIALSNGNSGRTIILEDTRAYPFTVNITFRGPCLFRMRSDNGEPEEGYYRSGEIVNVTSQNGLRIWASNINTMKIQVIAAQRSYDLEIGKAGAVKVEDIRWRRDKDGRYRLVVEELD